MCKEHYSVCRRYYLALYKTFTRVYDLSDNLVVDYRITRLDIIKVDKTFIDDIVEDDYAQAFIKLIVDLSKTIGTKIVVEGVEHKEQFELLKSLGVDYIQGYYFGKPVPANIFEEKNLEGRLGE